MCLLFSNKAARRRPTWLWKMPVESKNEHVFCLVGCGCQPKPNQLAGGFPVTEEQSEEYRWFSSKALSERFKEGSTNGLKPAGFPFR